ncbi:mucin-6-like [Penaeus japonicus]|uniref:mucin-6-like n=1 Tax=Penaeus japonicus TaxID=27405 RepID=UPI001C71488F|nr:mucin-6-like [Penaeus japonicus]
MMVGYRRPSNIWGVAVLSAAVLALAAVASGTHQRAFKRSVRELYLKERPLMTHKHLVGASSFSYRSARSVSPTSPYAQKERQQVATPEVPPRPGSPKEAERESAGSAEAPSLQANVKDSDGEGINAGRGDSSATGTEHESARTPKFVGKFKEWYRGKDKGREKDKDIVVISTGPGHGHYHHPHPHQHPVLQPIIIGSGAHGHQHPVVVPKPVTHYVTVPHAVPVTHTETVTHMTPSVVTQTSHVTYVTPSVVTAYVTQSHTPTYVTHTAITTYVTQSHVPTYVTHTVATTYVTQSHKPTYVTPSVVTAFVTQSHKPTYVTPSVVTAFVTQSHISTSMKPPVITTYVTQSHKPTYVPPSHVIIQEPSTMQSVTITMIKPSTEPTLTHTVMLQKGSPLTHTHMKGFYSGQGHFELQKVTLTGTPQQSNEKPSACLHCG